MKKKPLKRQTISEELYNTILEQNTQKEYKADLADYVCGYKKRQTIYYNENTIICNRLTLTLLGVVDKEDIDCWYQIVLDKKVEQEQPILESISPVQAVNRINKIIYNHYSKEEKEEIYNKHQRKSSQIYHYNNDIDRQENPNTIIKYTNCIYYDANGAYASELIKLLPKCEEELRYMFEHRHDQNNKFKNTFNYYVGCLTENEKKRAIKISQNKKLRQTFPETRHYIVQNVSDSMYHHYKTVGGSLKYMNTDGYIVKDPKYLLPDNKEIGTFKIEYQGDIYFYSCDGSDGSSPYYIYQYGDEIKGNLPLTARKLVDLRQGLTVKFNKVQTEAGNYIAENIEQIKIETHKEI